MWTSPDAADDRRTFAQMTEDQKAQVRDIANSLYTDDSTRSLSCCWSTAISRVQAQDGYPNREHRAAAQAADRRALAALAHISEEAYNIRQRIEGNRPLDGDDTQTLASLVRALTVHLTVRDTLSSVRQWHAMDTADAAPGNETGTTAWP